MKEFEPNALQAEKLQGFESEQAFTTSAERALNPVWEKVRQAAKQLRDARASALPLVVALANPNGVWVDLRRPELGWALYGDPTYGGEYNAATGEVQSMRWVRGRNGQLTSNHPYISAVVVLGFRLKMLDFWDEWNAANLPALRERHHDTQKLAKAMVAARRGIVPPEGDYPLFGVFHTITSRTGGAVPLPAELFDGPHDQHWLPDASGIYHRAEDAAPAGAAR